jgi:SAM-dependent methyltransferase
MFADLVFTGERFIPGTAGEIAYEHWHRYAFAKRFVAGKRVADVACGEGYGAALIAGAAASVVGVDNASEAITHARARYARLENLRFELGSANALPLPDASLDAVVSFETVEHLPAADQSRMFAEFARVLTPRGILVLSTPNPDEYTVARDYRNPFHCHEPERRELVELLGASFPAHRWFRQRRYFGSAIWSEAASERFEAWVGDDKGVDHAPPPAPMYFVVVAARSPDCLPPAEIGLSVFADRLDAELARLDEEAREVIRLDRLLGQANRAIDQVGARVGYLEELLAHREAQLAEVRVERDALLARTQALIGERTALSSQLASLTADHDARAAALTTAREQVSGLVAARDNLERMIAYRQSAHWWLRLPWFRAKLLWHGMHAR